MSTTEVDDAANVDFVLQSRHLPVTDEERDWLVRNYVLLRRAAARVRIPDVRYGEPALVYSVTVKSGIVAGGHA